MADSTLNKSIHKIPEEELFNYSYGRYISNGVLVLGILGGIFGIYCIDQSFDNLWWLFPGITLVLLCISLFIPTEMFQIDFKNHSYRSSIKVFSHVFGTWKNLGDVKYLSIIRISKHILLSDQNARNAKGDLIEECQLRLYIKPGSHIIVDDYEKKSSAIYIAKVIAKGLNVDILDATISPPAFILGNNVHYMVDNSE